MYLGVLTDYHKIMSEFIPFSHEVFQDFGLIASLKMFGWFGIYYKGVVIGLVADYSLYLKADKFTKKYFIGKQITPEVVLMCLSRQVIGEIWPMHQP